MMRNKRYSALLLFPILIALNSSIVWGSDKTVAAQVQGGPTPTATVVASETFTPSVPTETPTQAAPTVTPTLCPNPFVDINGNVFTPAILYLYCRGIVSGSDPTHYSPALTTTRGQFAKVVVLAFNIAPYTPTGGTPDFTDVPSSYFAYQYIETGFHAGILSGYDAATCATIGVAYPCYGPNRSITRAQAIKLVLIAAALPTPSPAPPNWCGCSGGAFCTYIYVAYYYHIINGYADCVFHPNDPIRRDEMAQIVYKAMTVTLPR